MTSAADTTLPPIFSVSEFTTQLQEMLAEHFSSVWIRGEISEVSRPASGHVYLTLKDETAQLKAVAWRSLAGRLPFELRVGQQVLVCGTLDIYPPRGSYQLIVKAIEPQGVGALQLAFQQLREKLAREGLFDPARKQPVPSFPRHIAFVTSPAGAAIRDFLQIASRRWRGIRLTIVPARVQGEGAAAELIRGLTWAQQLCPAPDVIVIGRGGGSIEDLWCFNDEALVRAIAAATIPVVSAVGHEVDVTLADLVADLRALTPSEAAERLVPAAEELRRTVVGLQQRLQRALRTRARRSREQLTLLSQRRVLRRPFERIMAAQWELEEWQQRLARAMHQCQQRQREAVAQASLRLAALSPLAVLARGYSVTRKAEEHEPLRHADHLAPGDFLHTQLARGSVISLVEIVNREES